MTDPLRGFEELAKYLLQHPWAFIDTAKVQQKLSRCITSARTEIRQGMRDEFVAGWRECIDAMEGTDGYGNMTGEQRAARRNP
jgi:hypothetical protein